MEETYPLISAEEEDRSSSSRRSRATPPSLLQPRSVNGESPDNGGGSCPLYFGVRSYLHHFYDRPTLSHETPPETPAGLHFCENCAGEAAERSKRLESRFSQALICKAVAWLGINVAIIGVIVLLLGHLLPPRPLVIGHQGSLEIVDRSAMGYNQLLDKCRLAGLALLGGGALILVVALILLSCLPDRGLDDAASGTAIACRAMQNVQNISPFDPSSAVDDKIPATERITSIQPVWENVS